MASERWPDFVILGAAKSGTTTLYRYLAAHPDVCMATVKEPRFFAFAGTSPDPADPILKDSVVTERAYLDLFSAATPEQKLGEASPIYLAEPRACDAMAARIPDARLVVILRDPAERAFSHFLMSQRQGYEPESSFIKALSEPVLTLGQWRRVRPYLPYSRYGEGLERYLARFPREQLLVLMTDELHHDQDATLRRLTDFIGVTPMDWHTPERANVGYAVRSTRIPRLLNAPGIRSLKGLIPRSLRQGLKQALRRANTTERRMSPAERAAAIRYLEDDIRKMERLLGRDLSKWRR